MGAGAAVSRPVSRQVTSVSLQPPREPAPASGTRTIIDVQSQTSQRPRDLMISYSHADKDMMVKIREKLEGNGITVWVDVVGLNAGVDFLSRIGQAIIDAKVKIFLCLMSTTSLTSRYCRDELALAYVTNKAIFPVTLVKRDQLLPHMDTGMYVDITDQKLQLANYRWVQLTEPDLFESTMKELIDKMKDVLEEHEEEPAEIVTNDPYAKHVKRMDLNRHRSRQERTQADTTQADTTQALMPEQFWSRHYRDMDSVPWNTFVEHFVTLYDQYLDETYTHDDKDWLLRILHREMEIENDEVLKKANFIAFCTVDERQLPLWRRVQDQACESHAMKEVFNMDSSVRVDAIENLGRFRSLAVVDALRDLLTDRDANVRAVAAISLARTEANDHRSIKHLMNTLEDKDRRNDVISHVREAASVALKQIGGQEVTKAMHVTTVLAEEIRQLTAE